MNKIYKNLYIDNLDKIYIKKDDVEDSNDLISLFTYDNGDEILSTLGEDDNYFIVPCNGYHKLEWDNVVDSRKYEEVKTEMTFSGKLRYFSGSLSHPPSSEHCVQLD